MSESVNSFKTHDTLWLISSKKKDMRWNKMQVAIEVYLFIAYVDYVLQRPRHVWIWDSMSTLKKKGKAIPVTGREGP
jgi:hypothetical protein